MRSGFPLEKFLNLQQEVVGNQKFGHPHQHHHPNLCVDDLVCQLDARLGTV
jgi:hypothetical protein